MDQTKYIMIIELPFKTPTINHLYYHGRNFKALTTEARELRDEIAEIVDSFGKQEFDEKLRVVVKIYENWLTQDGSVAKKDIANREKFLLDSVFKALGIDDKRIFFLTMEKVQSDEEKAVIEIWNLT